MAEDLLAFSADGPWQSWQMAEDLLAFSADGPGFLGIWSRMFWQMAKNLPEYSWQIIWNFSAKLAKNLSVFLVDCPGFVSKWSRISWHFEQIAQPALLGKAEDFLKLLADDHKDLLVCLRKLPRICH